MSALIVLGCVLASEPTVPETLEALTRNVPIKKRKKYSEETGGNTEIVGCSHESDVEFIDISSDDELTPSEDTSPCDDGDIPWLLKRCLLNIGICFPSNQNQHHSYVENQVPAVVKSESLQVISSMSRNYFGTLMVPHLHYISRAIDHVFLDANVNLRFNAGQCLDFIGQAMGVHLAAAVTDDDTSLTVESGLRFWINLVQDSLKVIVQDEHNFLRGIGCDCLGSVGPDIFERLPKNQQILIITLLLGCSKDEDHSVRGAAVRALAISVLYPSLRQVRCR